MEFMGANTPSLPPTRPSSSSHHPTLHPTSQYISPHRAIYRTSSPRPLFIRSGADGVNFPRDDLPPIYPAGMAPNTTQGAARQRLGRADYVSAHVVRAIIRANYSACYWESILHVCGYIRRGTLAGRNTSTPAIQEHKRPRVRAACQKAPSISTACMHHHALPRSIYAARLPNAVYSGVRASVAPGAIRREANRQSYTTCRAVLRMIPLDDPRRNDLQRLVHLCRHKTQANAQCIYIQPCMNFCILPETQKYHIVHHAQTP